MSAVAKNYVYEIYVTDDEKPEPTISKARLEECLRSVAPYLVKTNEKKNWTFYGFYDRVDQKFSGQP